MKVLARLFLLPWVTAVVLADGPEDNDPRDVRPIPPPGIEVPEEIRQKLDQELDALRADLEATEKAVEGKPDLQRYLPDVEIYHKAVDWALRFNQIYKEREFAQAEEALRIGRERAAQLTRGEHPWVGATGLVVRGYRSKIDGSVQPYGLMVPASYRGAPTRLDAWFHGRGETLSELAFLTQRRTQVGKIQPADTIVLHPYGRYSCANKFAGEIDLLEALDEVKRDYAIDPNRILVRGFSMGGAACWQFAVHYADRWCAAAPGAGFSETPDFLRFFQLEDVSEAPWYQKKLWRWYNATDNALNLYHCPTVAYSGELDRQKQAADQMEEALRSEQMDLVHLIGPETEHKIHPDSLEEIERRLASIAALGRDPNPAEVHFATWTLRYSRMHWIQLEELVEHWERTRVHGKVLGPGVVQVRTQNVRALTLDMPPGHSSLNPFHRPVVTIDDQDLTVTRPRSDRSWRVHLRRDAEGRWSEQLRPHEDGVLVKRPGLQGPIDDAFMDAFLMVLPETEGAHPKVDAWVTSEAERAQREWQRQFRGIAPTRRAGEVSESDLADKHLVLWGTPESNPLIARVLDALPIQWTAESLEARGVRYESDGHVPILIFPNPLNPERYVVLNSGFTYREYAYLNNARQVPMLPDWAIIDLSEAPGTQRPGRIADAGFFDEQWQWKAAPAE